MGTITTPHISTMTFYLQRLLTESEAQFTCSICSDLMENPATVSCGHTFCSPCIRDWFKTKLNCPCCRDSCTGLSAVVAPIEEYLVPLKPLLVSKNRGELQDMLGTAADPRQFHPRSEDAEMFYTFLAKDTFRSKLLEQGTAPSNDKALEIATTLLKCALARQSPATPFHLETFLQDLEELGKRPEAILDKYMDSPLFQDKDYQYVKKLSKWRLTLHKPTPQSLIQLGIFAVISGLNYIALKGLEGEGVVNLSEPLIRAISLLHVYIDLAGFFQ